MTESFFTRLKRMFGGNANPTGDGSLPAENILPPRADALQPVAATKAAELAAEQPERLTIWMIERDRYGVRGRALSTEVEVYPSEAVQLCDGVAGYLLNTPNGESVVVEARSGGLVGSSLESVLDGVRDMPSTELIRQIDTNRKEFNRMKSQHLNSAEFWAALRMDDGDGADY